MAASKAALFFVFLTLASIYTVESQTVSTSRRVSYIKRLVMKIRRRIDRLEDGGYVCNGTIMEVQDKMGVLSGRIGDLYKGTLLTELDLSRGYTKADKILCKLPNPIESCFKEYERKPIKIQDAQFICIQEMLWKYQIPDRQRQIRADQALIKRVSVAKQLAEWKERMKNKRGRNANHSNARKGRSLLMFSSGTSWTSSASSTPTPPTPTREPPYVRKSYHVLNSTERKRFHDAVRVLYENGGLSSLADIHRRASSGAHRGPAFLPWHRAFIFTFETLLREIDDSVTLPYWDSTLDDKLDFPTDSILWTDDYLGNGGGDVSSGPFKDFMSNGVGPIQRLCGNTSRLINERNIDRVMRRCTFEDIHTRPSRIEMFHNNVHRWVGGEMRSTATAPFDPIFYLHHCFIDYIWERFRERQRSPICGNDPTTDYMYDENATAWHALDSNMAQIPEYTVEDGLLDFWTTEHYRYEDSPTCANNCGGSDILECNTAINYCVPHTIYTNVDRRRRDADSNGDNDNGSGMDLNHPNGKCDQYLDPGCYIDTIIRLTAAKKPIPASVSLGAMGALVPRFRPDIIRLDPEETNDNRTILAAALFEMANAQN